MFHYFEYCLITLIFLQKVPTVPDLDVSNDDIEGNDDVEDMKD